MRTYRVAIYRKSTGTHECWMGDYAAATAREAREKAAARRMANFGKRLTEGLIPDVDEVDLRVSVRPVSCAPSPWGR